MRQVKDARGRIWMSEQERERETLIKKMKPVARTSNLFGAIATQVVREIEAHHYFIIII